jgi:hypothetical protein
VTGTDAALPRSTPCITESTTQKTAQYLIVCFV